jgi:RNA polymerase sigma-70 factor (ECF subfamily)
MSTLINAAAGAVRPLDGSTKGPFCFTVADRRIAAIELIANPERIAELTIRADEDTHDS